MDHLDRIISFIPLCAIRGVAPQLSLPPGRQRLLCFRSACQSQRSFGSTGQAAGMGAAAFAETVAANGREIGAGMAPLQPADPPARKELPCPPQATGPCPLCRNGGRKTAGNECRNGPLQPAAIHLPFHPLAAPAQGSRIKKISQLEQISQHQLARRRPAPKMLARGRRSLLAERACMPFAAPLMGTLFGRRDAPRAGDPDWQAGNPSAPRTPFLRFYLES
jgi:hypothetical protein